MVSVIIPTYNCSKFIQGAISSVLSQTYKDIEIIIVDDGSTDDTYMAVKPFLSKVKYIWQENKGVSQARNVGIDLAKGEFIAFLDADDIWSPEKLEIQMKSFEKCSDVACLFSDFSIVNSEAKILEPKGINKEYPIFKKKNVTINNIFSNHDYLFLDSFLDGQKDKLSVVYLILDGIRLGVRAGTKEKEAVLIAWAFLQDGRRELLGVSLGNQESYSAWKGFLEDMVRRGLEEPLLTVIDGCPGLIRAVEDVIPTADIQRCTKHKTENVLDKVLKEDRAEVKDSLRKIFYAPTYEHAKEAIEKFKREWSKKYPSALEILMNDIELCLTYYKYPYGHWRRIRTTNAVERSFREVRQRTKGIGRFKDEERALTMVYWQMKELRWYGYGAGMTKEARAILAGIRVSKIERMAA